MTETLLNPEYTLLVPIIMLGTAVMVTSLMQRLGSSPILGYLLAGLLIGGSGFGLAHNTPTIQFLAELGVVFLLFAIGLEMTFERLRVMRRLVFGYGGLTTIILMGIFGVVVYAGRGNANDAIVIGCALAFSSTALLVQLLSERGDFQTRHGRIAFAAALFQDLAVVPVLVVVPFLAEPSGDLLTNILEAIIKAIVVLIAIMYLGRLVLRPFYRVVIGHKNYEIFTAMTLFIVLLIGFATHHAGLSMALGAFLAGVILSETEFRHQIAAAIEPFRGLFLGLFFMTVGMMIDLSIVLHSPIFILLLTLCMMTIKGCIFYIFARQYGLFRHKSLRAAILLSQGGEFAFVIFGLAMRHGLMDFDLANVFSMAVIISMATTPVLVNWLWPYLDRYKATPQELGFEETASFDDKSGHVVLIGYGRVGEIIAHMLQSQNVSYIVIDDDAERVAIARAKGLPVFFGNCTKPHILRSLGIEKAKAAVIAVSPSKQATEVAYILKENWPHIPVFGRARDVEHAEKLRKAGVEVSVPITLPASLELGSLVLESLGKRGEDVDKMLAEIRGLQA